MEASHGQRLAGLPSVSDLLLKLRHLSDSDRGWVVTSWLRCVVDGEGKSLPRAIAYRLYEPSIKQLIDRSVIVVACLPEDPDVILGWVAIEAERSALHFVHVKGRWRRLGVASKLLEDLSEQALSYSFPFPSWWVVPAAWTYNPMARFAS